MNRREFIVSSTALALMAQTKVKTKGLGQIATERHLPASQLLADPYVESVPVAEYRWASARAYEAFRDMKFGVRIHWGIYSIWHRGNESWPFLGMSFEDRQKYNELYKTWNPAGFDAEQWMDLFHESGMKMFAFTTKHHEGFSMFDTKTRVHQRVNWIASGGPRIEPCDLAYSIMETPFRRDVVKELCDAAHRRKIKIDLYFSHSDWYDADFRPYGRHPLHVPSSAQLVGSGEGTQPGQSAGNEIIVPDPSPEEVKRMIARHRAQLVELLSNYGQIDMLCLDIHLGPLVWPELRKTILQLRQRQPDVMLRNRGIGNYGDYYTPERVVPASKEAGDAPWFSIYPLGTHFSYEPDAAKHKGTEWIVHNLVDAVAKGGGFMVGVGPDASGEFHPEAVKQMRATGKWLQVNGEAIYATRPREGTLWSEGEDVRYTRSKDGRSVYANSLRWPGAELRLRTVRPRKNSEIRLLGYSKALSWKQDDAQGLSISIPEALQDATNRPCQYAWCFKIQPSEVAN